MLTILQDSVASRSVGPISGVQDLTCYFDLTSSVSDAASSCRTQQTYRGSAAGTQPSSVRHHQQVRDLVFTPSKNRCRKATPTPRRCGAIIVSGYQFLAPNGTVLRKIILRNLRRFFRLQEYVLCNVGFRRCTAETRVPRAQFVSAQFAKVAVRVGVRSETCKLRRLTNHAQHTHILMPLLQHPELRQAKRGTAKLFYVVPRLRAAIMSSLFAGCACRSIKANVFCSLCL